MSNDFSKRLSVSHVIDYNDGPLIFAAQDSVGTRYLCTFLQTLEAGTEYLCVPISRGRLNSFLKGTKDLRSVYAEPEEVEFYKLLTTLEQSEPLVAEPVNLDEIKPELLPAAGYYCDPKAGSGCWSLFKN